MSLTTVTDFVVDLHLVGGIAVNGLLLYAIRRFSRQLLGKYKYLFAAFASFDVFLSIAHAFTRPRVVILDTIFGVVTDTGFVQDRRLTGAYCACFTVPFTLMNIHFLYRFWSIRYPHLIDLFSNKKFIAFIVAIPLFDFIIWYLICTRIMSGEADEPATVLLRDEYERRYGKVLADGWILVDYTDDGNGQRVRAFESMLAFDSIMIGSFSIAVTLAALTYKYISKADKLSSQAVYLQYKLLIAVCAQTFVPLVFVYLPYLGVNHLAFLRLPAHSIDRACMQLTACFPAWDAIIIICLIEDYREGLLSIIRPTSKIIQVETTWRTNDVTAITPTTL